MFKIRNFEIGKNSKSEDIDLKKTKDIVKNSDDKEDKKAEIKKK